MLTEARIMLCYVVMSFLTLCTNIYQNPKDPKATLDLKLMKIVTNFLSLLNNEETEGTARDLRKICAEFERLARHTVKNAQEKQASDKGHDQTPLSSSASHYQSTPGSAFDTTQTSGFPPNTEVSIYLERLPSNDMPLESAAYPAFRTSELTAGQQNSLLIDAENAELSQQIGTANYQMNSTDGTTLPSYTGSALSSDFWQLPMPLEWNWADMTANYFPME
jgi:hypothetical protein